MNSTSSAKSYIQILADINKFRITIMVAVTTLTGYIVAKRQIDVHIILPALGIFPLACGSSALNHLQEWRTDMFMDRTKNRPLPQKTISKTTVILIILFESITGTIILYFSAGLQAAILGLTALVWYNGIYTPLKKVTANAVIPGSVIGAIPPLVGWVAGNGSLYSPYAWILASFFFVWQVPHFYLLAYKYASQYKNAGFPAITDKYSEKSLRQIIYIWILATSVATILLQATGMINSLISSFLILIALLWLNIVFLGLLFKPEALISPGKYFMKINYFVLAVVVILSVDHLLI